MSQLPGRIGVSELERIIQQANQKNQQVAGLYAQAYLLQHQFQVAMAQARETVTDPAVKANLEAISQQASIDFNKVLMTYAEEAVAPQQAPGSGAQESGFWADWNRGFDRKKPTLGGILNLIWEFS